MSNRKPNSFSCCLDVLWSGSIIRVHGIKLHYQGLRSLHCVSGKCSLNVFQFQCDFKCSFRELSKEEIEFNEFFDCCGSALCRVVYRVNEFAVSLRWILFNIFRREERIITKMIAEHKMSKQPSKIFNNNDGERPSNSNSSTSIASDNAKSSQFHFYSTLFAPKRPSQLFSSPNHLK